MRNLDLGSRGDAFWCYRFGLGLASVCSSLPREQVEREMAERCSAGREAMGVEPSAWRVSNDETFRDGAPNPCACEDSADHRHWLLEESYA